LYPVESLIVPYSIEKPQLLAVFELKHPFFDLKMVNSSLSLKTEKKSTAISVLQLDEVLFILDDPAGDYDYTKTVAQIYRLSFRVRRF